MKITALSVYYPERLNRKETGQIIIGLSRLGHDVTLVTNLIPENNNLNELDNIRIIKQRGIRILSIYWNLIYYLIRNSRKIDCLLLYHLTFNTAFASFVYRLCHSRGILVVKLDSDGRVWGPSVPAFLKIYGLVFGQTKIVPRIISRVSDIITTESPESQKRILLRYPFFRKNIRVLSCGVDKELFQDYKEYFAGKNIEKKKKILFAGFVIPRKGIDILINAFAGLKDIYSDWSIEIVGRPMRLSYEKELKELVNRNNLNARVNFAGYLRPPDLIEKYIESEIFCFPSRHESVGLVILEAMFLGIPVISSDAGCAEYFLDNGKCGMIFENGHTDRLAERLKVLMDNGTLRKEIGKKAEERCLALFTWDKIAKQLDVMIKNAKQ
jgi:glycosyltransferase involved in cell wall biosynthesis